VSAADPGDRRLVASLAAHESWANTSDRSARTAPARKALDDKFLAAADGDPARAENLKKAHFRRLALRSAQRRREGQALLDAAEKAETELGEGGAA
jgi:hypothetical protein